MKVQKIPKHHRPFTANCSKCGSKLPDNRLFAIIDGKPFTYICKPCIKEQLVKVEEIGDEL